MATQLPIAMVMRYLLIVAICIFPAAGADEPGPPSSFAKQLFGPATYYRAGAVTALGQITNSPEEWGRGVDGIGKRFAASYGRHLISTTVRFSVATTLHEDLRYFPAEDKGFGARLRHAMLSTVVARDTTTGGRTLAVGRIAGAFAGGFVSRQWLPDRYHTVQSGLASSGVSLGIDVGMNVFREFRPKRRR